MKEISSAVGGISLERAFNWQEQRLEDKINKGYKKVGIESNPPK